MKKINGMLVGSLAIAVLMTAAVPAFATDIQTDTQSNNDECKYERVPIYGPMCHGYQMIIGYETVCTNHNH